MNSKIKFEVNGEEANVLVNFDGIQPKILIDCIVCLEGLDDSYSCATNTNRSSTATAPSGLRISMG